MPKPIPTEYPPLPAAVAGDLIEQAITWRRAPAGRAGQNARRRFRYRVDQVATDPLHFLHVWVQVVGLADAVIRGDLERGEDGKYRPTPALIKKTREAEPSPPAP